MNIKDSTMLFLGAGQVGTEAARQCAALRPNTLVIHCLTKDEADEAIATLHAKLDGGSHRPNLVSSYGNAFWPAKFVGQTVIAPGSDDEEKLVSFLYGQLTPKLVTGSLLYQIIEKYRPDFIVDGINTATAVGYRQCIYDAVRNALATEDTTRQNILAIARSAPEPQLVRFVQILKAAMQDFRVGRYIKVSTTGLGGMGFNIRYTHGDLGEPGLSTKLLGKISAAGILHQLLWTLRHTPGFNINLVIPAALIGWEVMGVRPQGSANGTLVPLVDCSPIDITSLDEFHLLDKLADSETFHAEGALQGVAVASGENGDYSWHDMAAITALGQMGCITKEEVAEAVVYTLQGQFRHCVLTAMDFAQMAESSRAFTVRKKLMEEMRTLVNDSGIPSASFMNLGPRVAKHLWELEIISRVTHSLNEAASMNSAELGKKCEELITRHDLLRRTILTLDLPIVTENHLYLPMNGSRPRTLQEVYNLADSRVVDLRQDKLQKWQRDFQAIVQAKEDNPPGLQGTNLDQMNTTAPIEAGETLGLWFTMDGGGKKSLL